MTTINGIPALGLGTWLRNDADGMDAILTGLELGYRHIDTAQTYGTERHVGEAIRASGLRRGDIFVTTKVGDQNLARRDFLPSLERSLEELGTDEVDLTLIHWPSPGAAVPLASYLEDLAEAQARGLTRLIGVSNFTCALIREAVAILGPGALATNQVEVHPYFQNHAVRTCCAEHQVAVTAYKPLANGLATRDASLRQIGENHGITAAAVALAWLRQRGLIAIPASGRRAHMVANLHSRDVALTDAELASIDALDRGHRIINPAKSPQWD